MTSKPIIHGRDHRPGGADPIPGVGGHQWAFIKAAGTTVAANGGSGSALTALAGAVPATTSASFYTNASDVFAKASVTIGGVVCWGIQMLILGHYECRGYATISNNVDNVEWSVEQAASGSSLGISSGLQLAPDFLVLQRSDGVGESATNWGDLQTVDGSGSPATPPTNPLILAVRNYSNTSLTASVTIKVELLDGDPTTI